MERAQDGFIETDSDGMNSRWIHYDKLRMEQARDGFVKTDCQPGPLTCTPTRCGQGVGFHPPGRGAVVGETPRGSGQASLGARGCGLPQHLCTRLFVFKPNHTS